MLRREMNNIPSLLNWNLSRNEITIYAFVKSKCKIENPRIFQ